MISFRTEKTFFDKTGIITIKKAGPFANAFRRVLLDEIETIRFNMSEVKFAKTDPYLTHLVLINVAHIHVYEEGECYLDVVNNGNMAIDIMSNSLKTIGHKPANVEQDVFICTLQPKAKIKITGLTTMRGIGRDHSKFSPIYGQIEYIPTDIIYVHYLNDRGFIETNQKIIDVGKLDPSKSYIVWSKLGESNMSEKDREYAKSMIKLPAGEYPFKSATTHVSDDFIVKFRSHDPETHFKQAVEVLIAKVQNIKLNITAGELIRAYINRESECQTYAYSRMIEEDTYELTINDQNAEVLKKNAIATILKILTKLR